MATELRRGQFLVLDTHGPIIRVGDFAGPRERKATGGTARFRIGSGWRPNCEGVSSWYWILMDRLSEWGISRDRVSERRLEARRGSESGADGDRTAKGSVLGIGYSWTGYQSGGFRGTA